MSFFVRPARITCLGWAPFHLPRLAAQGCRPKAARFSTSIPRTPIRPRRYLRRLGVSLILLPPIFFFWRPSSPVPLDPQTYSDQPCSSIERLSPQHALVVIPIPVASLPLFGKQIQGEDDVGRSEDGEEATIHHVMVKSPDLQIERPYTPINDVAREGVVKIVVKRVKGGEVGRLVHSLKPGDDLGIRGPVPTLSLQLSAYDKIIMVSSGTGIAPFLQLLAKISAPSAGLPRLHLIHALPKPDHIDWVTTSDLLPRLANKLGSTLAIDRIPAGPASRGVMEAALAGTGNQRVLVLVCLPPALLTPLCGPMTATLEQGEVTGLLRDLGLLNANVWKL